MDEHETSEPAPIVVVAPAAVGDVIRVERDFTILNPVFPTTFPASLATRISSAQFTHTVEVINTVLFEATQAAEDDAMWRGLLSCMTLHLTPRIWPPPERELYRRLGAFIEKENERVYRPAGLELRNPLGNGLLFVRERVLLFSKGLCLSLTKFLLATTDRAGRGA